MRNLKMMRTFKIAPGQGNLLFRVGVGHENPNQAICFLK